MRELSEHLAAQICGITHGSIRGRPFVSLLFLWLRPAVLEDSEACISLIRRNTYWTKLPQASIFHFSEVNLYVLRFQAESGAARVGEAALAASRAIEKVSRVKLHAWLCGPDFQNAACVWFYDASSK